MTVTEIRPDTPDVTRARWGIRLVGVRDMGYDCRLRKPWEGNWLVSYDPDALAGLGDATFSPDVSDAITFPTVDAAKDYWMQKSKVMPTRFGPSGEYDNRPLAQATNIAIDQV